MLISSQLLSTDINISKIYVNLWKNKFMFIMNVLFNFQISIYYIIPIDIIRFICILYNNIEEYELTKMISPCSLNKCKNNFYLISKLCEVSCNFYHKKCIYIHCNNNDCHNFICKFKNQVSWQKKMNPQCSKCGQIFFLWHSPDGWFDYEQEILLFKIIMNN